jgi:hypothetical protein
MTFDLTKHLSRNKTYTVHNFYEPDDCVIIGNELHATTKFHEADDIETAWKRAENDNFDTIRIWEYKDGAEFPILVNEIYTGYGG